MLDGTAKPIPTLPLPAPPVAICELTPTTRPRASSSGPPELPGLIGASVWITSSIWKPSGAWISRPSAGDDPGGGGAVEAERVADGDDRVADPHALRVGQRQRAQRADAAGVDAQDGEVGRGVGAEHLGLDLASPLSPKRT